jgi:hypothetical protein
MERRGRVMLFVTIYKPRPELTREQQQEIYTRRLQWNFDPTTKVIGEYFLIGTSPEDPTGVLIYESDNAVAQDRDHAVWADLLDIRTHLAIPAEEGLKVIRQMVQAAAR